MSSSVTVAESINPVMESDQQTLPEQEAIRERRRQKRRRRRARTKAKLAEQAQPTNVCTSPTPSPAAQLRAELVSSTQQQAKEMAAATANTSSRATPLRPTQAVVAGDAVSAALLKLNDGVSSLIHAFSPSVTGTAPTCVPSPETAALHTKITHSETVDSIDAASKLPRTSLTPSNLTNVKRVTSEKKPRVSRAKYTPKERKRRQTNRRLVREYGYDMSEDDLDDLFPSRRHHREQIGDFDDDFSTPWAGGSEKFEYTMSFINGCRL